MTNKSTNRKPWEVVKHVTGFAIIQGDNTNRGYHTIATGTDEANAKLIAAAPELLEAARRSVLNLEDYANPDGEYKPTAEGLRSIARELRAAIENATS